MTTGMKTITDRAKYTATISAGAVTAATPVDIFELAVPSGKVVVLHEVGFTTTETTSAKQRIRIRRLTETVTSGSGGSTATPVPMFSPFDNSSVASLDTLNSTKASTTGDTEVIVDEYADVVLGWIFNPVPTRVPVFGANEYVIIDFPSVAANLTVSANIVWEELELEAGKYQ